MKAIDFACRLLLQLDKDTMPNIQQRILISVGAGLECCQDIAAHCNLSPQQASAHLAILERHQYIIREKDKRPDKYYLPDKGKEKLRCFFNFIPPEIPKPL